MENRRLTTSAWAKCYAFIEEQHRNNDYKFDKYDDIILANEDEMPSNIPELRKWFALTEGLDFFYYVFKNEVGETKESNFINKVNWLIDRRLSVIAQEEYVPSNEALAVICTSATNWLKWFIDKIKTDLELPTDIETLDQWCDFYSITKKWLSKKWQNVEIIPWLDDGLEALETKRSEILSRQPKEEQ